MSREQPINYKLFTHGWCQLELLKRQNDGVIETNRFITYP